MLSRDVEPGQIVASSLSAPTLFTLAEDLSKMQLEVDIDEADMGKVTHGDAATFTVEAYPGKSFPAEIAQVRYSPETVEGVVTYTAVLTVDNSGLLLRPGMTATADITVETVKDAMQVPNAALRWSPPAAAASDPSGGGAGLLGLLMPRGGRAGASRRRQPRPTASARIWVLRDGEPVARAGHGRLLRRHPHGGHRRSLGQRQGHRRLADGVGGSTVQRDRWRRVIRRSPLIAFRRRHQGLRHRRCPGQRR